MNLNSCIITLYWANFDFSSKEEIKWNLTLTYWSNKKNPVFKVYGDDYNTKDGTCIRDYIHVSDIAKIHFEVLKKIVQKIVLN